MQRLNPTDEFFVQNGQKNSQVFILYKIRRLPYEKIKVFARDHFGKFENCRVRLSQAFGRLFWKQLSKREFDQMFEKACIKIDGIHSM